MVPAKKIYIALLAVLITGVIILVPRIWICDWERSITLGATLLGGFTGVFAIVFGYFIYKDLGIAKVISDKQVNCAFGFLEELNGLRYQSTFFLNNEIELMSFHTLRNVDEPDFQNNDKQSLNEALVLFSPQNFYDGFENIKRTISSSAMPPELLTNLRPYLDEVLPSSLLGMSEEEMNSKYQRHVRLTFLNSPLPPNTSWTERASGEVKIGNYVTALNNLVKATKEWLEKNSDMKLN
jgi:hypothetical protein